MLTLFFLEFRFLERFSNSDLNFFDLNIVEPIGSVSPKISTQDRFIVLDGQTGSNLNLICPAQAYPTPVFR